MGWLGTVLKQEPQCLEMLDIIGTKRNVLENTLHKAYPDTWDELDISKTVSYITI